MLQSAFPFLKLYQRLLAKLYTPEIFLDMGIVTVNIRMY